MNAIRQTITTTIDGMCRQRGSVIMPGISKGSVNLIAAVGTLFPTLCLAALIARVALVPDSNHWGFDTRWLWLGCLPSLLVVALLLRSQYRRRVLIPLCAALLLAIVVAVFDHFNILVEYESWLARGMPEAWHVTLLLR